MYSCLVWTIRGNELNEIFKILTFYCWFLLYFSHLSSKLYNFFPFLPNIGSTLSHVSLRECLVGGANERLDKIWWKRDEISWKLFLILTKIFVVSGRKWSFQLYLKSNWSNRSTKMSFIGKHDKKKKKQISDVMWKTYY